MLNNSLKGFVELKIVCTISFYKYTFSTIDSMDRLNIALNSKHSELNYEVMNVCRLYQREHLVPDWDEKLSSSDSEPRTETH